MQLWKDGLISGEMHLGTGEEAIVAGVLAHLREDDAMALDHRSTPPLIMRGVDPPLILRELLGQPDGLCGGKGGHMHLFSKQYLAASSGIVGATGPTAAGFALAAQYLRPGSLAVAFLGEGSMNQGMVMESMNLASAWKLPVLFVCKDDNWSITTDSSQLTGGSLSGRARNLGLFPLVVDGRDVIRVWETARKATTWIRDGKGPVFLQASCVHLEGHFLGYQLIRIVRHPFKELPDVIPPLAQSFIKLRGAPLQERLAGVKIVLNTILETLRDPRRSADNDPILRTRKTLQSDLVRLEAIETAVGSEIYSLVSSVLREATWSGK